MTRFLRCFALGLAILAALALRAAADSYKDCVQTADPDLEIKGCTSLLAKKTEQPHTHAVAYNNRGYAYALKGEYERALADLGRAIELNPQYIEAYNNRAFVYLKAGKAADGLADAERALQFRPGYADALDTRGQIFEALGKREEAIADFRRALAKDPNLQTSKDALKRLGAEPWVPNRRLRPSSCPSPMGEGTLLYAQRLIQASLPQWETCAKAPLAVMATLDAAIQAP